MKLATWNLQRLTRTQATALKAQLGPSRDALARLSLVAFTEGVNDPIRRESADMACIDHICGPARLSANVRSTTRWPDAPKPVVGLSDHFGVAVELD